MTLTVLHSRGITAFELPPPTGADALPPAVQAAIRELVTEFWSAQSAALLEKMASPRCKAVWLDWCKNSRDGNKSPVYLPLEGQFDAALCATAKLIFELCYAAVLRATAETQFEISTAHRLKYGHVWRDFPEPPTPLLVAPQGQALKQLVP